MRLRRNLMATCAAMTALTLAGCGSSATTTSSATAPSSAGTPAGSTTASTGSTDSGSTVAGSGATVSSGVATPPQTASPGATAPRGSIVAAPGRATPVTGPATTVAAGAVDTSLQATIDLAVADLAKQLNVAASTITAVSAKSVEWPDKSDGCPQPGMSYSQVPVDGVLIVLSQSGTTYEYHSGGSRSPFLCKKG